MLRSRDHGNVAEYPPRRQRARLRNEVAVAIALKVVALVLLSLAFFSGTHRPHIDSDTVFRQIEQPAAIE